MVFGADKHKFRAQNLHASINIWNSEESPTPFWSRIFELLGSTHRYMRPCNGYPLPNSSFVGADAEFTTYSLPSRR